MAEDPRTLSTRLLLAGMDPTGRAWEEVVRDGLKNVDWPWVLERARAHKLIGLLARRTLDSGIEDRLPDGVQEELETERWRGLEHRSRVARTLSGTRDILAGLGCPFMVVKGSVYAHDLYDHPTMRRFSDIDILIPHEKLDAVDRAFKKAGYFFWADPRIHNQLPRWFRRRAPEGEVPGSEAASRRILAAFHRHHLYVLKQRDPRMHVEVHWHLFVPKEGRASVEDVWKETRPTALEGIEARTLGWEASLLHAAAHAMEQPPNEYRLLHLADVIWMLARWGDRIDPEKLRRLAKDWGLRAYLTGAVMVAERVLPGGLPGEARELWPNRNLVQGGLLSAAGFGPWTVEHRIEGGRGRQLLENAWREGLWELAVGRRPGTAWGRVSRAVQARFPRAASRHRARGRRVREASE